MPLTEKQKRQQPISLTVAEEKQKVHDKVCGLIYVGIKLKVNT